MLPAPHSATARNAFVVFVAVVTIVTGAERRRTPARAQPPLPSPTATPCAIAATLRGAALRDCVHSLAVSGHRKRGTEFIETDVLMVTEQDPTNSANVIDVYFDLSLPKVGTPTRLWDVEHAWPSSIGFSGPEDCNVPLADAHHLFVADRGANGSGGHSNDPFDFCHHDCTPMPVSAPPERHNKRGKDAGGKAVFEVWRGRRGDIARALLYMDVRYDGGLTHADKQTGGGECHPEPELRLVDRPAEIGGLGNNTAQYGELSTMVRWALQDPVDDRERFRNEVIARPSMQGNRNPFVDDEGLICQLFPVGPCRPAYLPAVFRP